MPSGIRSVRLAGLVACNFLAFLSLAFTGGCNQGPYGDTGGVIGPYTRTRVDVVSPEADSVTMLEFADQVGAELSAALAQRPEIRNNGTKVLIELGSLVNHTRTPSSDFAAIQRKVFLTLVNSDLARDYADIVEDVDRMDRDATHVSLPGQNAVTSRYPLKDTYFLQGTFSELSRGGGRQSTYVFDFTLTNAESRKIVFARQITPKQVR